MKKRILQFTGSFHQGGSERQATSLAVKLKEEGTFDVYLATLDGKGPLRSVAETAGFNEIAEFPLTSFYDANFVKQVRRCAGYLRENKIDLVHTHDFYTNVFGMAAATLARIPARVASKRETDGMRSRGQEFVESVAFGRAKAIVANSAAVKDHLVRRGIKQEKVRVIYNGVDAAQFELDAEPSSVLDKYRITSSAASSIVTLVANLRHEVKNIPMLLRAAKRVLDQHPNTLFVVAGEGELEADLRALAGELRVAENIHFIGRCTDVPSLLAASDICVLTSKFEGFSNSILEYMAAGKPVVATNVGGAAEAIVEGETGYLVSSDDDEQLAARLSDLLKDPTLAAEFGKAGRRRVNEGFSSETQITRSIELYSSLLT